MPSRIRRVVAVGAAAGAAVAVAAAPAHATVQAMAVPGSHTHKVIAGDFPDPGFAKFTTKAQGTKYYLYATGTGFRVADSTAAGSGFKVVGHSMPKRPPWTFTADDTTKAGLWAPHVFQTSTTAGSERFTMYFSARRKGGTHNGQHCVGAATSSSPTGAFTAKPYPMMCPTSGFTETIDPFEYTSRYGNKYLVYKNSNPSTHHYQIKAVRVDNATGTKVVGSAKVLLSTAQIGSHVAEAPDLYRSRYGNVYLFVSRNSYLKCDYATQVWKGKDMFHLGNPHWVGGMGPGTGGFCGPGGAEVLRDNGTVRVAFHTRASASPLTRPAWTGVLTWSNGVPHLS